MNNQEIILEPVEIEAGIREIRDKIFLAAAEVKQKNRKKFNTWIQNLDRILDQISKIDEMDLPPVLKEVFQSNKNLIVMAMVQPSTKNIFNEIQVHFHLEHGLEYEKLQQLAATSEIAQSLAWIGDTAIKTAILKKIWRPGISPEELHNARRSLEMNENLSGLCDRWNLFEYRIHLDPEVPKIGSIIKIEGTLVEAMFGIIFIEKGDKGVQKVLPLIANK